MRISEALIDAINNDSACRKFDLEHWMRCIRAGVPVPEMLHLVNAPNPVYCHTISHELWQSWMKPVDNS